MVETLIIILGALLILAGIAGSFLPVLPGPPLSYLGLLTLQFTGDPPFTAAFLLTWALIVIAVVAIENFIPAIGTKKFGGSRLGILGCFAGLVVGIIFFPPAGIILGPLAGAFTGELIAGQKYDKAFRAALGSFVGFLAGTLLKFIVCVMMGYYFVVNL